MRIVRSRRRPLGPILRDHLRIPRSITGWWFVFASLAAAALIAVFFALPPLMVPYIKDVPARLKAEHDVRTAGIQLVGAIAVLAASVLTARTIDVTRRGQVAERFGKAVAMVADDHEGVRLAGVYSLEQVIADARGERAAILELLAANVRREAPVSSEADSPPPPAVRATLPVLSATGARDVDLSETNLRRVMLVKAHLRGANLNRADLTESDLSEADLREATLIDAILTRAELEKADLRGALLQGAQMHRTILRHADLRGADLAGAQLQGANLLGAQVDSGGLHAADLDAASVCPDGSRGPDCGKATAG